MGVSEVQHPHHLEVVKLVSYFPEDDWRGAVVAGFAACRGTFSVISVSFLNPEAAKYFVTRKGKKEKKCEKQVRC